MSCVCVCVRVCVRARVCVLKMKLKMDYCKILYVDRARTLKHEHPVRGIRDMYDVPYDFKGRVSLAFKHQSISFSST